MYPCDKNTYYYDNTYSPGFGLLNHPFYVGPNGGAVMDGYYSDGAYVYTVTSGVVTAVVTVGNCGVSPTPTPIQYYEHSLAGKSNSSLACDQASAGGLTTFYSEHSTADFINVAGAIDPATDLASLAYYLYTNSALTSTANNFYYSDATYWWRVTGGSGRITNAGLCPVP
jgi:hypothetical protein